MHDTVPEMGMTLEQLKVQSGGPPCAPGRFVIDEKGGFLMLLGFWDTSQGIVSVWMKTCPGGKMKLIERPPRERSSLRRALNEKKEREGT